MGLLTHFYKKMFIKRYDDDGIVKYFTYKDFKGLNASPIEFKTPEGNVIKGNIYSYSKHDNENIVIFCHGLGGGHYSYMREIEKLAKHGYQVIGYDNVGCFESTGKDIRGFTESINDLFSCINFLKENKYLENKKLSVIGHSWGGYAAGNILNFYKDIHSVTVLSGFVSIRTFMAPKNKLLNNAIYKFEKKVNPTFVDSSSIDAYRNSNSNILLIHSKDDNAVGYDLGLGLVQKELGEKPNIKYITLDGKLHNPHYSNEAIKLLYSFYSEYAKLQKVKVEKNREERIKYINSLDFMKMTDQDEEIWSKIFENIDK